MSGFDLSANLAAVTASNDEAFWTMTVNWKGFVHMTLFISCLINLIYLVIVRGWAMKQWSFLTNVLIIMLSGQCLRCLSSQAAYIYYDYFIKQSKVLSIMFAVYGITLGRAMITSAGFIIVTVFYFIGIKQNYSYFSKTVYGKIIPITVTVFLILQLVVESYAHTAGQIMALCSFIPVTLLSFIFYHKLYSKVLSIQENKKYIRLYWLGYIGFMLAAFNTCILSIVAIGRIIGYGELALTIGICWAPIIYPLKTIGLVYLSSLPEFTNILHRDEMDNVSFADDQNDLDGQTNKNTDNDTANNTVVTNKVLETQLQDLDMDRTHTSTRLSCFHQLCRPIEYYREDIDTDFTPESLWIVYV